MAALDEVFLRQAIDLAVENVRLGRGGPFGALVVKDGNVVASGTNLVTAVNDPTAHAEVTAIRAACRALGTFQLDGCVVYTSCEPCPMCLGAIYWSRAKCFYFAADQQAAALGGFDDSLIYEEVSRAVGARSVPGYRLLAEEGSRPFEEWHASQGKVRY